VVIFMSSARQIAVFLLVSACAFAQAPNPRSIFDTGLAASLLSASTPPGSITEVKASEGWGPNTNFASGSWVEIQGKDLTQTPFLVWNVPGDFTNNVAPTSLGGVSVFIDGKSAFVYYISPTQIGVEAPDDPQLGNVPVTIINNGVVSNDFFAQKTAVAPGLLAVNYPPFNFFVNGKQYAEATFGLANHYVGTPGLVSGFPYPFDPAKPGDTIFLYGIGFGDTDPPLPAGTLATAADKLKAPLTISFDQTPANISYAGHYPTYTGLYLFALTVPDVPAGDHQIIVTLDGQTVPQTVYLTTTR
jgi:uncharacterized protein (TIGR03437 family)